jgi:GT2 family glycosyltransferase
MSVIIPTYQRRDSLVRLLAALTIQSFPSHEFEVVVVVDGSTDGTYEMLMQRETNLELRILNQPNRGRPAARNAGIRLAAGEILVFLDDDMQPQPGFLAGHLAAHRSNPRSVVLGPIPVILSETSTPAAGYIAQKFSEHMKHLCQPDHQFQLRDFYGSNFSVCRQDLLQVGFFDETFREYGSEDVELFYRLLKGGIRPVYAPEALAYQYYDKDLAGLAKDSIDKGRSAVHLVAIHPDARLGLKLATYHQASRKRRFVLGLMVMASRANPRLPGWSLRVMPRLETFSPRPITLFYSLLMDYFYWYGAASDEVKSQPCKSHLEAR